MPQNQRSVILGIKVCVRAYRRIRGDLEALEALPGIEPGPRGSKPLVLPLYDRARFASLPMRCEHSALVHQVPLGPHRSFRGRIS